MMVVLVTGVMRSGTSLVSRQLHLMGIPMGTEMRFPLSQPNGQEDWEDIEFTDMMIYRIMGRDRASDSEFKRHISSYANKRSETSTWGVKSPFALPYVELIKEAIEDEVKVVLTRRDIDQTYESLRAQNVQLDKLQGELVSALPSVSPDLMIEIEESWHAPEEVGRKLLNLVRS